MTDSGGAASSDVGSSLPTSTGFDQAFLEIAVSPGMRRVWELADLGLPPEVEPLSFVSAALLEHVAQALALSAGETLVDLGCGRGGPGLWLAQQTGAALIGVDFSTVGVAQASERAAQFQLADRARFVVGDFETTGLRDASADAVVSIDAFHFAADLLSAAREALRILRRGRRLVLTQWQRREASDPNLPALFRDLDWTRTLGQAGFQDVHVVVRPDWHNLFTRIYHTALSLGEPGDDAALAALQDEARRKLPTTDSVHRVLVTATAPDNP